MNPIQKTNIGLLVELPLSLGRYDADELKQLSSLRDHINALEAQVYFHEIAALFDQNAGLEAIRIDGTDNYSDNGRHIVIITEDASEDVDWEALDQLLSECANTLNYCIRHRGIYDYIDELLPFSIIDRKNLDATLGKAYDKVSGQQNSWAQVRSDLLARALDQDTSPSQGLSRKQRI